MDKTKSPSKYVSMTEAARMCDVSLHAFRASFNAGFFPFPMYRVTAFRNKFKREDVEAFLEAQEQRLVHLSAGEKITAAGIER